MATFFQNGFIRTNQGAFSLTFAWKLLKIKYIINILYAFVELDGTTCPAINQEVAESSTSEVTAGEQNTDLQPTGTHMSLQSKTKFAWCFYNAHEDQKKHKKL